MTNFLYQSNVILITLDIFDISNKFQSYIIFLVA